MASDYWLTLGIDLNDKSIKILAIEETEFAAITQGDLQARTLSLNPDLNGRFDLTKPSHVVRPLMLAWMHKHGIPEYQATKIVKDIAKRVFDKMQESKTGPVAQG